MVLLALLLLLLACGPHPLAALPMVTGSDIGDVKPGEEGVLVTGAGGPLVTSPLTPPPPPPSPSPPGPSARSEHSQGQTLKQLDASTSVPPLQAPLAAAYVGHPLAPNAIEQRQRIIDGLVAAIKVMLGLLLISGCCLLYLSNELDRMKNAIKHRLWKRR